MDHNERRCLPRSAHQRAYRFEFGAIPASLQQRDRPEPDWVFNEGRQPVEPIATGLAPAIGVRATALRSIR